MDYLYWNKHQLIGMLIDVGLNKLVSSYNFEAVDLAKQLESMVVQVLGGEKVSIHANGSSLPPKSSSLDPLSPYHLDYLYQIDAISQFTRVPHHELLLQSLS